MDKPRETFIAVSIKGSAKHIRVLEFNELGSTNDLCKEMAVSQEKEPFVVRALFQRKGRGRYDRVWVSPRDKNLLFSIVMYPCVSVSKTPLITILAAQAIIDVLQQHVKATISIKQPNDVLCNGKKVAGILTEQESMGDKSSFIVVGIGLNVNAEREEIPGEATSLFCEEGREFDRDHLFKEITHSFFIKMHEGALL